MHFYNSVIPILWKQAISCFNIVPVHKDWTFQQPLQQHITIKMLAQHKSRIKHMWITATLFFFLVHIVLLFVYHLHICLFHIYIYLFHLFMSTVCLCLAPNHHSKFLVRVKYYLAIKVFLIVILILKDPNRQWIDPANKNYVFIQSLLYLIPT